MYIHVYYTYVYTYMYILCSIFFFLGGTAPVAAVASSWRACLAPRNCRARDKLCCRSVVYYIYVYIHVHCTSRQPLDEALTEPQWSLNTALVQPEYSADRALVEP